MRDNLPAILHMNHWFKYIILYLTMVAIFISTFNKSIILLRFYINQRAIVAQFCINKERPWMHCNGHCYLRKQIQNEQQQEEALADAWGKNEMFVSRVSIPGLPTDIYHESIIIDQFVSDKVSLHVRFIDKRLLKPPITA